MDGILATARSARSDVDFSNCVVVKEVHTRFVVQNKKGEFLSHRRNNGYCNVARTAGGSHQDWTDFEHARVWARECDAARVAPKGAEVVPVTVALGKPYAVFTE